jgi:O-antigen/teichoic acid export membrane protein
MMIGAPIAAGMMVLGDSIVPALFGEQWGGAVGPMRVICLYALLLTLEIPGGTIFKVTGRASMLLKLAVPRTIALYAALILFAQYGLVAVAACLVGVTAVSAAIAIGLACHVTGARPRQVAATCWAPLASAIGAGLVMLVATQPISGDWPRIIFGTAVGGLCYVGLLWVTARDSLMYLLEKTLPRFARA